MKEVRLNNGVMMPAIGFGVYQIPVDETERIVSEALETGYRMIDTAASGASGQCYPSQRTEAGGDICHHQALGARL